MGVIAWLFIPLFMLMPTGIEEEAAFVKGFTMIFLFGAPLFYAALGFITGLIGGLVYNLMAKAMGGLRFKLNDAA